MGDDKKGFSSMASLFDDRINKEALEKTKKAPAYEWQEIALGIIDEFGVPAFKRSSVFKICKENTKERVERGMNDTRELCKSGDKWKYFFKVMS